MHYFIVILPGDGVGKEVAHIAQQLLATINMFGKTYFQMQTIPCGGEYYLQYDQEWPENSFEVCSQADAILLGAVGYQHEGKPVYTLPDKPYRNPQLAGYAPVIANRKKLDLFANIRPVKLYCEVPQKISGVMKNCWEPNYVDYVIIKENTEDAYTGEFIQNNNEIVTPIKITKNCTEKFIHFAADYAVNRNKSRKITCVDKSNIIVAHRYFREIVTDVVTKNYPMLTLDFCYADTFSYLQLSQPENFDVVVAPNLIGDIISEVGAISQGGLGMAPSANIGHDHAMFEPIHGSALDQAGKDTVNPFAMLLAVKMMFEWLAAKYDDLHLKNYAICLDKCIQQTIKARILPADLVATGQVSYVASYIAKHIINLFSSSLQEFYCVERFDVNA